MAFFHLVSLAVHNTKQASQHSHLSTLNVKNHEFGFSFSRQGVELQIG